MKLGWEGLLAFFLVGAPQAASADWLVLHGGEIVETLGSWKVEGRQLLFTSTRQVYSSLRLADVDLESSRALSREKSLVRETPPPAPVREPLRRHPAWGCLGSEGDDSVTQSKNRGGRPCLEGNYPRRPNREGELGMTDMRTGFVRGRRPAALFLAGLVMAR